MELTTEIQQALAQPFADDEVKWKPQLTEKKDKTFYMRDNQRVAGCTAHIDARSVMNRLDEVVGVGNWSDSYRVLPNGVNVECTLVVCGVSKADVGEPNQGGFSDKMKAAYSDALKRAAVKFGIGRFLYDMEMEWLPYDGYKITALPKTNQGARPAPSPAPKTGPEKPTVSDDQRKPSEAMIKKLHAAGKEVYGDEWDERRAVLINSVTGGRSNQTAHLTFDECKKLIDGIEAKRQS